jgi:hypothetical protein
LLAVESNYLFDKILWASGSQSVLRKSQEIRDMFPEDPWIQFCNGYFEVFLFFNESNNVLLKLIAELLELLLCLFSVAVS